MNTEVMTDSMTYLNTKEVFTSEEAARYAGLSVDTIRTYCQDFKIPHSRPNGGKLYIRRVDLEAWMMGRKVQTNAEVFALASNRKTA